MDRTNNAEKEYQVSSSPMAIFARALLEGIGAITDLGANTPSDHLIPRPGPKSKSSSTRITN